MGKKQHEDLKLLKKTHHEVLATVLGRYDSSNSSFSGLVFSLEIAKFRANGLTKCLYSCSKEESERAMIYSYKHGFSGFAAKLTETQAQTISGI